MHLTVKTEVVRTQVSCSGTSKFSSYLHVSHAEVFLYFLRLVIPVHVQHLQICCEFFKHIATSQFSVKNAIVWDVTPCSLVEIHPYFGRTCYPECAVSRFL